MPLSKSDYMLYLRHPAWLWFKKFDKTKLPPVDDALQAMFDAGHEFEAYAEQLFPDAVRLGFSNYNEYLALPTLTQKTLDEGAKTIFQGRFEAGGITCIIDVLDRVEGNTFDLIEIKSSTKAKEEHFYDLSFQKMVLEKAGITVRNIEVMHVNNTFVRQGEIDPAQFASRAEITSEVNALEAITTEQIKGAFEVLATRTRPDLSPRYANLLEVPYTKWAAEWLDIYKSLRPELDPYSIYNLSYPTPAQIGQLEDAGYTLISDLSDDHALRPRQASQIQVTRQDERLIDAEAIQTFLKSFEYPLYFFDYETFSNIVPAFDGLSPYQDYPFQYSLHSLDAPGGELRHTEFLHAEQTNPMLALLHQLQMDIGERGTVLTWNMGYEKKCNETMANLYPEFADFIESLNARINDLMLPFSNLWFVDKAFYGSASIKKVLPVLVPELSYKELDIFDGLLARRLWMKTVLAGKNPDKLDKVLADLREYCTLDTLAMVKIFWVLQGGGDNAELAETPNKEEKSHLTGSSNAKQLSLF